MPVLPGDVNLPVRIDRMLEADPPDRVSVLGRVPARSRLRQSRRAAPWYACGWLSTTTRQVASVIPTSFQERRRLRSAFR